MEWYSKLPQKFDLGYPEINAHNKATPNRWFNERFPEQVEQFGPVFLEVRESSPEGFTRVTPVSLNYDACAAILSDPKSGMSTIYSPGEIQWYYLEPLEKLYMPTTPERIQCLYRGIMMRCHLEINQDSSKFALFHQFRDDACSKAVVNRARSILACDENFFAPDSTNLRKAGPEWPERVGRVLIESLLERKEGAVLTLTRAYNLFTALSQQRDLKPIKKTAFKDMMKEMMKEAFGVCLRNDVPDENNKQQTGWKGVSAVEAELAMAG
jgi:hypothetical protein